MRNRNAKLIRPAIVGASVLLVAGLFVVSGLSSGLMRLARNSVAAATAQLGGAARGGDSKAAARVSLRKGGPGDASLNFADGVALRSRYDADAGSAQGRERWEPLALAAGDFDGDGVADLLSAYAAPTGGVLTLRSGSADALFPNSREARARTREGAEGDAPFRAKVEVFELDERPDFVAAGDFDADGHTDLIAAAEGGAALSVLKGDGRGKLGRAERLELPGQLTALAVGEFNRADGLADIVVGVAGPEGARALVYTSPEGAAKAEAATIALAAPARALALGQLDEDPASDLAVAAGDFVQLIPGRAQADGETRQEKPRPSFQRFTSEVRTLALGDFAGDARADLAVLTSDGTLHLLWRGELKKKTTRAKAVWHSENAVTLSSSARKLMPARVSTRKADDLLVLDREGRQLQVVIADDDTADASGEAKASDAEAAAETGDAAAPEATAPRRHVAASLADDEAGAPAAVLPMRLNGDAINDLVVLKSGASEPFVLMSAPVNVFSVDSTGDDSDADTTDDVCEANGGGCTLRAAIQQANASAGADLVVFDLAGTGTFTISPATQLPVIKEALTIDGTTQVDGLIELNGTSAGATADGLRISKGSSRLTGLIINRFADDGVELLSGGNIVDESLIGTNDTGTADLGNGGDGVSVSSVSNNLIGGTASFARNVISGNQARGIIINGTLATGNVVQGNLIGTDSSGAFDLGNTQDGVRVTRGVNNQIGGSTPGTTNVISGNNRHGVFIDGAGGHGNVVQGNHIGVNATGNADLGNSQRGVLLTGVVNNQIGGTSAGARNTISGNDGHGVELNGSSGNVVQGNFIGTNAGGFAVFGSHGNGVLINGSPNNTIGGSLAGAGNVISGHNESGVRLDGSTSTGNVIAGNFIGTDHTGTIDLGNTFHGVHVSGASNTTIGGTTAGARNIISGNNNYGVLIENGATGVQVVGNYIGTNAGGSTALGNGLSGVVLSSPNNTVGGTSAGARNLISGNNGSGIFVNDPSATAKQIVGNYIGTDASGTADLGNSGDGVIIVSSNTTVGGTAAGAGNLISGNSGSGIHISGGGVATGNQIQGNYIGTDAAGTADLGNSNHGVRIGDNSNSNTVGGTSSGARNVISGNGGSGVHIFGVAANGNTVLGNYIGTDAAGTADVGNTGSGVHVQSAGNTVGGSMPGAGNVISGNDTSGILIISASPIGALVQGNYIGTDASGTADLGNAGSGVDIQATGNTIGGTSAGARNVISGNDQHGVIVSGASTTNNVLQGNYIGVGVSLLPLGNSGIGVLFGADTTTVGGTAPGAGNVIASNGSQGIYVVNASSSPLQGNSIYDNGGLGIDLNGDGVTPNDAGDADAGANNLQNFPVLNSASHSGGDTVINGALNSTASTQFTLEFWNSGQCDPSGHGEGKVTMGTTIVTTDGSGNTGFTATFPGLIATGQFITATATDPAGNTSEFSQCRAVASPNYVVNSTANGGDSNTADGLCNDGTGNCTLRAAIQQSNADGTASTINFAPALAGQTIQPASSLPGLGEGGTTINGDMGNDCVPDIELDGVLAGGGSDGLHIFSNDNTVRGLLVNRFSGVGIRVSGGGAFGNDITCNYIGTDLTGTVNRGNTFSGVRVDGGAHDNQVGPANRIAFNDAGGGPEGGVSVLDGATNAYPTFTSLTPDFTGQFPSVNFATGGAFRHSNGSTPIDGNNQPFTDNFGARLTGTLNVSAAGSYNFTGDVDDQMRVVVDGTPVLDLNGGNSTVPVVLSAGDHTFEVDYFNGPGGARLILTINGPGSVTFTNGMQPGLFAEFFQLRIPTERNRITQNSIYQNNQLGIELDALEGPFGPNLNDPGDNDLGPNTAINQPVLQRVTDNGGGSFTVQGTAPPSSTVEIFGTTNDDPSGHGEGKAFITSVTANSNPDGPFSATFNAPPGFTAVTATATDAVGNTSEFARNVALAASRWGNVANGQGTTTNISGPSGIVAGDLNGDGRLDLVSAGHSFQTNLCHLFVQLQNGSGQYSGVSSEPMGAGAGLCNNRNESLAVGDVDADGDLDLVAQGTDNASAPRLLLFKNDGAGTFTQQPDILSPGLSNGAVALGDLNGDGRLDLVASGDDGTNSRLVIFTNDGSGLFSVSQQPLGPTDGVAHGSIALSDREKDGDLDMVVGGQTSSGAIRLSSLTNTGGSLAVTLEILPPGFVAHPRHLRFADLDMDGDLDLLWTASAFGGPVAEAQLYRTTNTGGGYGGGPPQLIYTELTGGAPPVGLAVGDASGDGFPDAFMLGTNASLTYFQGSAGGLTLAEQPPAHFTGPIIFGDFDNDDDLDLSTLPPNDGLYVNQTGPANAAPSAPTGLNAVVGTPNTELRWSSSADAESTFQSLNYEVRIGTASGVYNLISGVYGTPLMGTHPLSRVATTQPGRRLSLGPGTYFWQARAIDTGLRAGAWSAESSFSIQPTLTINDVSVAEGDAGTVQADFTVTLAGGSGPVTVDFNTQNGSAFAAADYVATSGTLNLSPMTPTQLVSVTVNGDTIGEANEQFSVNLTNASGALIADNRGTGTITNDEPAPTISINDTSTPEGNAGTRAANFTVHLSGATHQIVTVAFDAADGSATTADNDYADASGVLTFQPGELTQTLAVTINGDATSEGDQNFVVNLSAPTNASFGDNQGTGTITDDEANAPPPSLAAAWTLAREGIASINAAASDGSLYVVAGNTGDIWTSPDAVNWTKRANPDPDKRAILGLTFGGGQFVAVGQSGLVLTSPDGVNWTDHSLTQPAPGLRAVAFGGGIYVAATSNGSVRTSPDGVTWTNRPTGTLQTLNGVTFGGGLFVAVGGNRSVITSPDGINWTVRGGIPAGVERNLNSVTHTGSLFVVVSSDPAGGTNSGGSVMTSPDGVNWTQASAPTMQGLFGTAVGGGVIVAVGNAADANGTFLSSPDGINWTARAATEPGPGNTRSLGRGVTHGPAGFIAGTGGGTVYNSADGIANWESRTLAASRRLQSVAHNGATFCAVGQNGAIFSSPDGSVWTQRAGPDHNAYFFWSSVTHAVGLFVAVGISDSIMTSPDCVTWTVRNPSTPLVPFAQSTGFLGDVTFGGGLFVASGEIYTSPTQAEVRLLTSPDGINWTPRNSGLPPTSMPGYVTSPVAFGGGVFVAQFTEATTGAFRLTTSPDGVNWTPQPASSLFDTPNFEGFADITFASGQFVAVGDRIWTSTDGVNWTLRLDYPPGTFFNGVAHKDGRFVAVGFNGTIYASGDGVTWSPQTGATTHNLNGVAVAAGVPRFVAVGESAIEYADFPPLTFNVNSAADTDDGNCNAAHCTLREAINAANAVGGLNTITFQIGSGAQTIAPTAALPAVNDPVTIDATTQPGFTGTPLIEINGTGAGAGVHGLIVNAGNSTVKGLAVNRFGGHGILLQTNGGNTVAGNYLGTDLTGTIDRGNTMSGIHVTSSSNLIGGTTPAARNLVSGNDQQGVSINSGSSGNTVHGNYIGTNAAGTARLPNNNNGVLVMDAPNNQIGGAAPGAGNLISGNGGSGIRIAGTAAVSGNVVRGNLIGTDAGGTASAFNASNGITLVRAVNTSIGGTSAGEANVIAFNGGDGITLLTSGTGNAIRLNSIFSNAGDGFDIGGDGVTANDAGDADGGLNLRQNFPVLTSVVSSGGTTTIQGTLNSAANTAFRLEFFVTSTCDASGHGEGKTFVVVEPSLSTNGSGNVSFTVNHPAALTVGHQVTATATDPAGNTSEFSQCRVVSP